MFAVRPTLTITRCAASGSRTDPWTFGRSASGGGWKARPAGVGEEPTGMGAGSRGDGGARGRWAGQAGLALSTAGSDLTCDKHRGFPLCTLGPEGVLALELEPHTEEAELVYRSLLQDPQARICRGEG